MQQLILIVKSEITLVLAGSEIGIFLKTNNRQGSELCVSVQYGCGCGAVCYDWCGHPHWRANAFCPSCDCLHCPLSAPEAAPNGPEIKVEVEDAAKFKTHLPIYSMDVLCGPFADGQEVRADGWVRVSGHGKLDPTQFVVRTKGLSMEGLIPDGAMCIMRKLGGGGLVGKTILVQRNDAGDPELGGAYTIKTYVKRGKEVLLKAKNPRYDILLKDEAEYSQQYRAIAEFKTVLS